MIRKKTLRLLLYDYLSGETTTIGYDYSSRNATTIADLYWLSGESPKRVAAVAANGSAPPAAPGRKYSAGRVPGQAGPGPGQSQCQEAPKPRRAVPCQADRVSALASDPHTVGADPAAAGMVCPLIYLIIIGGLC